MMLGAALSVPASLLAAWAPSGTVLIAARVSGGVAAGLLYPITLSLITELFRGGARTRAIALWSGIDGGCSALGPLPAAVFVAAAARPAGRMITTRGSRVPLALGLAVTAVGFGGMALLFGPAASAVVVGIVYGVLGLGIGLAGPPSSSSLMGSVPVARAGMGSASNDLQRDFGGALFQAVMGTLLAVSTPAISPRRSPASPHSRPSSCPSRRRRPSASRSPAPRRSPSSSPRPRRSSSSPPPSRRSWTARRPPSCSP
jgi:MFS transporter, DHA2 family, multidrug resistance protein